MIIDQLIPTVSDNLTDEIPVEQGELTFKTTWQKILNLFSANMDLSNFLKLDGTSINYWASNTKDLNDVNTGIVLCKENVLHTPPITYYGTNEYWLVVSTGSDYTTMQIAFPAFGTNSNEKIVPMIRVRHGGLSWSSWYKLPYVDKTGDTMTGSLNVNSSNVDSTVVPSGSGQWGDTKIAVCDKNGVQLGYFSPFNTSSGNQGAEFTATRNVGGNNIYNGVQLQIDANGKRIVNVHEASAWREALGLGYANGTYEEEFPFFGFVTTSSQALDCYLLCQKPIVGKTLTINSFTSVQARIPTGGYINNITKDKIQSQQNRGMYLRLVIYNTSGWGVTNNIPVTGVFTLNFTIS